VCEDHFNKPWGGPSDSETACNCGELGCLARSAIRRIVSSDRRCRTATERSTTRMDGGISNEINPDALASGGKRNA
jgi:hypothetical protein